MSRQYIYTIERLSKKIGPREVLKDIWLAFYPGAKIGVLGRNGAGKSTLLRIMAGSDKEFDGEPVQIYEPRENEPVAPPDTPPMNEEGEVLPDKPGDDEVIVEAETKEEAIEAAEQDWTFVEAEQWETVSAERLDE